ncbi:MAG: helix-turn-helix domain-containing protein [Lachnospiraceae bacterium]|nr:helix-turn-helix domain-containing protein [Lachnospiraceae bacterium]MCD8248463.1 helix-turn-helix domain-containing protein [Lachnospiraceae bacterium]
MKIADAKSFGEAIRKRRKELHYTQGYLSACTGLSITFISDLERGKPSIQLEKAIQLVNILGMDLLIEKRGE